MSTSSQVYPPAFKIYRHSKPNKCEICRDKSEDHDWDDGIGSYQPLLHDDDEPAPPPYIVLVQGPPNVGKSLLIKSLVKHYTEQHMIDDIQGPITIRTGQKRRRLQFVECPDDINSMIDAAKFADIVLLMVDASYGFEAETFEFLSLLRVHGLPKVMGVLTHLDHFKDEKELNETKERLQDHFQTEICEGATTFHLSGLNDFELYKTLEVQKLAEAISMLQLRTLSWRAEHPYVLVHIAGVGDFHVASITSLADPLPLSSEMEVERDLIGITHMDMGSFRTGMYLRLQVHDVPFGMVENLNPCHPILVGGVSLEEESVGYIQARLKRHNWRMRPIKPLKSSDLVTVSAGWRRYQTKPIYAREIDNGRHQILKFAREHNHCLAMFWGPLAPPLTRIAVVQSNKEAFRVAAKAVVLDFKPDMKIMKEIKLKGTPLNINQRKSLIKFEPEDIDVAEFIGSPIWTRSGNRGHVNEATKRDGIARCTFKRMVCTSDIVFMRVLRQVEAARFFNSLPAPLKPHEKGRLRLEQRRGVEIMDVYICPIFGTTVVLVRNKAGTYIATDGCEFEYLNPREERSLRRSGIPQKPSTEERDKIYEISDNIFAAPSGCGGWFNKIIYTMSNR
ncbi:hypothetical protein MKX03_034750, partial [Papaver bracteatum]